MLAPGTRHWLAVFLFVAAPFAFAQQPGAEPAPESKGVESKDAGYYINASYGRFLPYGIYGVRDVYPYWGFRFGHPFGQGTGVEWSGTHINAKSVSFYSGSVSLVFPSELESWKFLPYVGLDVHYYSGKTNLGELPFSTSMGFHIGVSPLIEFGNVALRFDFKFNFNPGRSLNVGSGLQYTF